MNNDQYILKAFISFVHFSFVYVHSTLTVDLKICIEININQD